ncbi:MAG: rod shape-determining protein MreC [Clostridiales bacterium]|jgi:rod shape-determining protein MreC|nr:rod shape-determining protein MreC [Clostridiales bacterium]
MNKYFKNKYKTLVLTLTIASSLTILISIYNEQNALFFDSFSNFFLMPIQKLFTYTEYALYDFFHHFENVSDLLKENEKLIAEIENKNVEISKIQSLVIENKDLKKMLDLRQNSPKINIEISKIISRNAGNIYKTFTLNKGEADSIKNNQTVITVDKYLIGRIHEVGQNWAKVITIFDEKNAVGARVVRSLELGVVESDYSFDENLCKMTAISSLTDITIGDYVETSGGGGIYPEGILIGTVLEIHKNPGSIAQTATIKPLADFNNLKNVFILRYGE